MSTQERSPESATPARIVRVAGLQLQSVPGDIHANLAHATPWVEQAAAQGAQLAVLPELYPSGYYLTKEIWRAAEPMPGPTTAWLSATARRLGLYLGAGLLHADGRDMINRFVLYGPDGEMAGQVAKRHAETYFFRPVRRSVPAIPTALGLIGVGICADNHYVAFARQMQAAAVDLMIMPHAWPGPTRVSRTVGEQDIAAARGYARDMAPLYARLLGVPALFVNAVGPVAAGPSRRPGLLFGLLDPDNYRLLGLSAIANAAGETVAALDYSEEGLAIADVTVGGPRPPLREPPAYDGWLHPGSPVVRRVIIPLDDALARATYTLSAERKRLARERAQYQEPPAP